MWREMRLRPYPIGTLTLGEVPSHGTRAGYRRMRYLGAVAAVANETCACSRPARRNSDWLPANEEDGMGVHR